MNEKFFCVRKEGNWHSWVLVVLDKKIIWADDEKEIKNYSTDLWRFSRKECEKLKEKYGGGIVESFGGYNK